MILMSDLHFLGPFDDMSSKRWSLGLWVYPSCSINGCLCRSWEELVGLWVVHELGAGFLIMYDMDGIGWE